MLMLSSISPFISNFFKFFPCFKCVKDSLSLLDLTHCIPCSSSAFICFSPWSSIVFLCFSKTLLREEHVNLAYSIILLWSKGSISSPLRYSYSSTFQDDSADIFAASLLISYCHFSSLIL